MSMGSQLTPPILNSIPLTQSNQQLSNFTIYQAQGQTEMNNIHPAPKQAGGQV